MILIRLLIKICAASHSCFEFQSRGKIVCKILKIRGQNDLVSSAEKTTKTQIGPLFQSLVEVIKIYEVIKTVFFSQQSLRRVSKK